MLKTDMIIKLLKNTKKPMTYDVIWDKVKIEVMDSFKEDLDEFAIKTDLYMSLLEDEKLIMIGDNTWDLKEKYSNSKQASIIKSRMTEETEIILEKSNEEKNKVIKIKGK
ncbi:MAG: DNA-directed RNA polymerase subunit delta [Mycoplasmataceae bacterium]|nr:DNA-directed RNA polymerase subunit delta [Mycoplasmataceae bacterium]